MGVVMRFCAILITLFFCTQLSAHYECSEDPVLNSLVRGSIESPNHHHRNEYMAKVDERIVYLEAHDIDPLVERGQQLARLYEKTLSESCVGFGSMCQRHRQARLSGVLEQIHFLNRNCGY